VALPFRKLGRSDLRLSIVGFGSAGLGQNSVHVEDDEAERVIALAWAEGVRLFDTAPGYGIGLAEYRIGEGLYRKPRSEYVLTTKVGRRLTPGAAGDPKDRSGWIDALPFGVTWDFTYDGIMRSFEDSLLRLRTDRVDALYIHDLDQAHHTPDALAAHWAALRGSGIRALEKLRQSGTIRAFGAGINFGDDIDPMLEAFDLDALLIAAPYTLLHQDALAAVDRCHVRGVGVVIGAVFQSGLLATGMVDGARYNYGTAIPADVERRLKGLVEVCAAHDVPLPAAALQFPLGHPAVAAVVPGATSTAELSSNLRNARYRIPADFWDELRERDLICRDAPTPRGDLDAGAAAHDAR
jgi:D-threo-aldose 1-dehydrogenase